MCIANEDMYQRTALRFIYIRIVYSGRFRHVHPACSTNAGCVLSHRPNRLHHADTYVELRGRRDLADLERVDQLRQLMHYSDRVLHHPVGDDGHPWQLCNRQPHLIRCVWQPVRERATDMYQRTALGNIHAPNLHTRSSDLYPACCADADRRLPRRTNRLRHADAYVELHRGSDLALVERVEQYGDYVYHSRCAVVHRPVGCDRRKRCLRYSQPRFIRCIREHVYLADTYLYKWVALRFVSVSGV